MVRIKADGTAAVVTFDYDPSLVAAVKLIPGRRWNPTAKAWSVPVGSPELAAFVTATSAEVEPELLARITGSAQSRVDSLAASRATDADIDIPVPSGLSLLPFQKAGVQYALARTNTLVADEMGLGKTVQAIALVNADPTLRRVVVVCPASLKINWKREIEKWATRPTTVVIGNGQNPTSWTDLFGQGEGVLVVNYDVLGKWRPFLMAAGLDLLVLDEAHYIKTPKAQRTVNIIGKWDRDPAKRIEPIPARRRVFLTGTPILNRPAELWTIAHALAPETFRSWRGFMVRYADAHETRWGWDTSGASNLDELQSMLRQTVMVRRLKADVLTELPAKRRSVIELPANPTALVAVRAELAAYEAREAALKALRAAVEEAEASEDPSVYSAAVEALRRGVSVAFEEMAKVRHDTALAKVPAMIDVLKDAVEQGKVVFMAWHRDVVEQIASAFGDAAVVVTGDTPLPARQAAVDRFQTDPTCLLFVGNIRAAGVGLTLTASSHVIFGELDWTPGNVTQAEDRTHRIGQVNAVLVNHLVLEGSLDATMARTLVEKQNVLDAALDDPTTMTVVDMPVIVTAADDTEAPALPEPVARRQPAGEGIFRAPDGTVYKVQRAVHGSGRLYAKRLVVEGNEGTFVMAPGAYSRIDPAWRMSLDEARKFGALYGFCVRCGRTLTDEVSIANGIGPICGGRAADWA